MEAFRPSFSDADAGRNAIRRRHRIRHLFSGQCLVAPSLLLLAVVAASAERLELFCFGGCSLVCSCRFGFAEARRNCFALGEAKGSIGESSECLPRVGIGRPRKNLAPLGVGRRNAAFPVGPLHFRKECEDGASDAEHE